ncbi:MAG: hypothetical protein BWY82_02673 [Verrucomicrobia bacterium ADurb.Bin474]|nr:MAG: hypothetical protein BWY82_02673 [Verrucomicrobia bacterium ADurb.Bin474]
MTHHTGRKLHQPCKYLIDLTKLPNPMHTDRLLSRQIACNAHVIAPEIEHRATSQCLEIADVGPGQADLEVTPDQLHRSDATTVNECLYPTDEGMIPVHQCLSDHHPFAHKRIADRSCSRSILGERLLHKSGLPG